MLLLCFCIIGCGRSLPTAPDPPTTVAPAPAGPRILLAGQSNAYFLRSYLPEAIDLTNIDGSVDFWLSSREFADASRSSALLAFVWWQGAADVTMTSDQYAGKLRSLIGIARAGNAGLPVRIVEIAEFPIRASVREAQRQVASDPGVELIPTSDLELADAAGHYTPSGYQTVRDRIYRSLGR